MEMGFPVHQPVSAIWILAIHHFQGVSFCLQITRVVEYKTKIAYLNFLHFCGGIVDAGEVQNVNAWEEPFCLIVKSGVP